MILDKVYLRILEEFIGDYNNMITGSQIAIKKNLNQKTVSNKLKELKKIGYLKSQTQGKNKLYYLNLEDKEKIKHLLCIVENTKTIKFYEKNPLIKEISSQISGKIVIIFGSYAKYTQKKDSDLDVFIVGKYNKEEIRNLSKKFQININVKNYNLHNFKKSVNNKDYLVNEIIKNNIIISGIENYITILLEEKYEKN